MNDRRHGPRTRLAQTIVVVVVVMAVGDERQQSGSSLEQGLFAAGCDDSPVVNLLPRIVGPMAGAYPAWLVGDAEWAGRNAWAKSLLIVARDAGGPLELRGHLVGGNAVLGFQKEYGAPTIDALRIADPAKVSVRPGGASPEEMAKYAFLVMSINYPAPGCWQFDVVLGSRHATIVRVVR